MLVDTVVVPAASGSIDGVKFCEVRSAIDTVTDAPVCAPDFNCTTLVSGTLTVTVIPPPPLRASISVLSTVGVAAAPMPTSTENALSADCVVRLVGMLLRPTTGCSTLTARVPLPKPGALAVKVDVAPACPLAAPTQKNALLEPAVRVTVVLAAPTVVVSLGLTSTAVPLLLVIVTVVAVLTLAS
jgi:hypothetical protein